MVCIYIYIYNGMHIMVDGWRLMMIIYGTYIVMYGTIFEHMGLYGYVRMVNVMGYTHHDR